MDSLNTFILVGAGAAAVGIAAVVVCTKTSGTSSSEATSKNDIKTTAATSKPKKKKTGAKKSKSKSASEITEDKQNWNEQEEGDEDVDSKPKATEKFLSKNFLTDIPPPLEKFTPECITASKPADTLEKYVELVEPADNATTDADGKKKKPKETPEQKTARLERQKQRVAQQAVPSTNAQLSSNANDQDNDDNDTFSTSKENAYYYLSAPISSSIQSYQGGDGWAVVEGRRTKPGTTTTTGPDKTKETTPPDATATPNPVVDLKKSSVTIDSKKVGVIIGPKGSTLKLLQETFHVEITTPKSDSIKETLIAPPGAKSATAAVATNALIGVTGPAEGVAKAIKAITELSTKGYSSLLEGEDFKEGTITVHPQYIPEIIGKGGANRKAIQDHTETKISIPANVSRDGPPVKITIAGNHVKVAEAKKLITELMTNYHTAVTHPGLIHEEMEVPQSLYNLIIGARGGEIKHIQNNFKVSVNIPNSDTLSQHVIVVGEPKNVSSACAYIQKIMDKATQDKEAAVLASDAWAEHEKEHVIDQDEEWMKQYMRSSAQSKVVNILGHEVDNADDATQQGSGSYANRAYSAAASTNGSVAAPAVTGVAATPAPTEPRTTSSWASAVLASADGW